MLVPLVLVNPTPSYRIVDLGAPPQAREVLAVAVNDRGEVLVRVPGYATGQDAKGELTFRNGHGYLWRAGRFLDFGEPRPSTFFDPPDAVPTALNDLSVAVGTQGTGQATMSGLTDVNPFIWRGKGMDDLGAGWSSVPLGINDLGDVVGDSNHRGFARLRGTLRSIDTLSHVPAGNRSSAVAINDHRLILGNFTYGGTKGTIDYELPSRPFTINGDRLPLRMRPVPLPNSVREAEGLALNDRGSILMQARNSTSGIASLYLRRGKELMPLQDPSPVPSYRDAAMNDRDEVVATAVVQTYPEIAHPVLWRKGRAVVFPGFAGWTLQTAAGINDKGQICGTGLHEGKVRVYLLIPANRPAG